MTKLATDLSRPTTSLLTETAAGSIEMPDRFRTPNRYKKARCRDRVLKAVWKLLGLFDAPLGVSTFAAWVPALAGSNSLVSLCGRYLPERIRIDVGF